MFDSQELFNLDPNFRRNLTAEQQATLETIEGLAQLDPEVTARLARALDRLQVTLPYQQLSTPSAASRSSEPATPQLSAEERAVREEFITQELSALLAIAGQLTQSFQTARPQAQADRRFREGLRAQFKK